MLAAHFGLGLNSWLRLSISNLGPRAVHMNSTGFLSTLEGFPTELPPKEREWILDGGQKFPVFIGWIKNFEHSS